MKQSALNTQVLSRRITWRMNSITVANVALVAAVIVMSYNPVTETAGPSGYLSKIKTINEEIFKWYTEESKHATLMSRLALSSPASMESKDLGWPRKMMRVLQLAIGETGTGAVDSLSLKRVVDGLKKNDQQIQREFMGRFKEYLKKHSLQSADELCVPYRRGFSQYFNFFEAINNMIKAKNDEKVDERTFFEELFATNAGKLYAAAIICQVMDAVMGKESEDNMRVTIDAWPYPEYKPISFSIPHGRPKPTDADIFNYNIFPTT